MPSVLNADADGYLFFTDSRLRRVFARVRFVARAAYLRWWSGSLLFSRVSSHGGLLAPLVDFLIPAYVALYSDDVSAMTIFTYNNYLLLMHREHVSYPQLLVVS